MGLSEGCFPSKMDSCLVRIVQSSTRFRANPWSTKGKHVNTWGALLPTAVPSTSIAPSPPAGPASQVRIIQGSFSPAENALCTMLVHLVVTCILPVPLNSPQLKVWSKVLCRKLVSFVSKSQKSSSLFTGWQKYTHFSRKIFALERDYCQSNEHLPSYLGGAHAGHDTVAECRSRPIFNTSVNT